MAANTMMAKCPPFRRTAFANSLTGRFGVFAPSDLCQQRPWQARRPSKCMRHANLGEKSPLLLSIDDTALVTSCNMQCSVSLLYIVDTPPLARKQGSPWPISLGHFV